MKALFVRGFNTYMNSDYDRYNSMKTFLESRDITVDYINYSTDRDIYRVYEQMGEKIEKENYDYLIGHSMGGCLVTRFMHENPEKTKSFKRVILLMPFVNQDPLINIISNIPIIKYINLPKAILFPENELYEGGNIFNDKSPFKFLKLTQIMDCYTKLILRNDELITTLNKNKNSIVVYAREEKFTIIPTGILRKIKNKRIIDGKHECFYNKSNTYGFFEILSSIL